jgi:hypothetical protein
VFQTIVVMTGSSITAADGDEVTEGSSPIAEAYTDRRRDDAPTASLVRTA